MTEEEFLRRIDRHIEVANENLADLRANLAELKEQNVRGNDTLAELKELNARANENLATMKEHTARANEHMARGNEHMARGNEHMARGNEHTARGNELMDDIRRGHAEFRDELRELRLQSQAAVDRFEAEVRLSREERISEGRKNRAVLDDLQAESRAGRDALFVILDEIRGRGQGPAAAGA